MCVSSRSTDTGILYTRRYGAWAGPDRPVFASQVARADRLGEARSNRVIIPAVAAAISR